MQRQRLPAERLADLARATGAASSSSSALRRAAGSPACSSRTARRSGRRTPSGAGAGPPPSRGPRRSRSRAPSHSSAEHQAREHGLAVHEHGAGAALAQLAAVLRAREAHVLAQHLEQRLVRRERHLLLLAVHVQRERHLLRALRARAARLARRVPSSVGAGSCRSSPPTRMSAYASAISRGRRGALGPPPDHGAVRARRAARGWRASRPPRAARRPPTPAATTRAHSRSYASRRAAMAARRGPGQRAELEVRRAAAGLLEQAEDVRPHERRAACPARRRARPRRAGAPASRRVERRASGTRRAGRPCRGSSSRGCPASCPSRRRCRAWTRRGSPARGTRPRRARGSRARVASPFAGFVRLARGGRHVDLNHGSNPSDPARSASSLPPATDATGS